MECTFERAMLHLKEGKKIRRKSWDDKTRFLLLVGSEICGTCGSIIELFTTESILATDWEIINE